MTVAVIPLKLSARDNLKTLATLDKPCATAPDPAVFYPTNRKLLREAEEICGTCPGRVSCLAVGVAEKEWGVWGGVLLRAGQISTKGVLRPVVIDDDLLEDEHGHLLSPRKAG